MPVIDNFQVSVYIDDGRVFQYWVKSADKGREHSAAIVANGYRHNDGAGEFEHYGAHRVLKVKVSGGIVPTKYPDTVTGTEMPAHQLHYIVGWGWDVCSGDESCMNRTSYNCVTCGKLFCVVHGPDHGEILLY